MTKVYRWWCLKTVLTFLGHNSFLFKHGNELLLIDPWYIKNLSEDYIPSVPLFIHPVYLTSIKGLKILITKTHENQFDERLMSLFDKQTIILIDYLQPDFICKKLRDLGFTDIRVIPKEGLTTGQFHLKFFSSPFAREALIYSVRTEGGFYIHANEEWNPLPENILQDLRQELAMVSRVPTVVFSPSHTISGLPLTYEEAHIVKTRVSSLKEIKKKAVAGIKNLTDIGVGCFISYDWGLLSCAKKSIFPFFVELDFHGLHLDASFLNLHPGNTFTFQDGVQEFFPLGTLKVMPRLEEFYEKYDSR